MQPENVDLPFLVETMMAGTEVFQITPTTQQYDWGKLGSSSKVAQFASASRIPGFSYREDTPYAEVCSTLPEGPPQDRADIVFQVMDGYTCDVPFSRFIDGRAFVGLSESQSEFNW